MHNWHLRALLAALTLISGCGGGGGDSTPAAPAADTNTVTATAANVQPFRSTPGGINLAFTSARAPGSGNARPSIMS
jgi:hypothetical protein